MGILSSQSEKLLPPVLAEGNGFKSSPTSAAFSPDPFDSDAGWLALQRKCNSVVPPPGRWKTLFGLNAADPLQLEVEDADRKGFFERVKRSYERRLDTIVWSMMVFIIAATILIPMLGFSLGPAFAAFVCLSWTVVHRVRRI